MIKTEFTFQYAMRWLLLGVLTSIAGCAAQSPVVSKPDDAQAYDQVFETAMKAMKKMGSVQFSDRERGTISGFTPSGVTLEVEIIRDAGRAPQLQVQAHLPEGMADMGNINEPDRYLDIYRQLSAR